MKKIKLKKIKTYYDEIYQRLKVDKHHDVWKFFSSINNVSSEEKFGKVFPSKKDLIQAEKRASQKKKLGPVIPESLRITYWKY